MKRTLGMILVVAMVVSCMTFFATPANALSETYELGEMTVDKLNGLWTEPSTNAMAIFTPGNSMNARYWTKLYARYNSELDCYVVEEKIGCHRNYPKTVENGCIGIMINYAPLSSVNSKNAMANWKVFDRIKVGDRLTFSGINFLKKTLETSGTYGQADYVSNAKIHVTAVRDLNAPKTPYSDKVIVAMGDSITVGGGWTYDLGDAIGADIINSGFGGDTAHASLAARYEANVAAYNPDIVIVSFGINDAASSMIKGDLEAGLAQYEKALRDIYARNTALGAKTVFMNANNINTSYFEDNVTYNEYGGFQGWLDHFIPTMEKVAKEYDCVFIDLYSEWRELGWGYNGTEKVNLVDNTHPTEVGYDLNLSIMIPVWQQNYQKLCDYEGTFDFSAEPVDPEKGDVNGDGEIDNIDAALVLKYDAGLLDGDSTVGDVNGDGTVDNIDAALILKYDAGLIEKF